ncbi:MAG: hypothetical protein IJ764_00350 [Bacteroidales bacterium]|nr:hypothetical protein [Bacteroidales bacterium]
MLPATSTLAGRRYVWRRRLPVSITAAHATVWFYTALLHRAMSWLNSVSVSTPRRPVKESPL